MKFIYPPYFIKKIFKNFIWEIKTNERNIFLTFDDCSSKNLTYWVLDTLRQYNIKATFFCTGKNIEGTNIINDIIKAGHRIGNHSYSHLNGFKSKIEEYVSDVQKAHKLINSDLYRPPYGKIKLRQAKLLRERYKIVLWSVISYDFDKNTTPTKCFENIKKNTKSGSIIVFHTNEKAKKNVQYALPATIEHFLNKGYSFESIPLNL
ncbi:MAG: polysaccharide deacetylase family protein [Bacteroidales bacterium]|nr:polysaccharide deacetylase family protein [Bacteroidales bacterium]